MVTTIIIISVLVLLAAELLVYGTISFLLGGIRVANIVLRELFLIRYSRKRQKQIISKVTIRLNRHIREELSQIISQKNSKLIREAGDGLSKDEVEKLKRELKQVLSEEVGVFDEQSVMKICDENMLFSFIGNLNEIIKNAALLEKLQKKNSESGRIISNELVNKRMDSVIPPVEMINVNDLYNSILA